MTDSTQNKDLKPIPQHVAIIMDGNGRWAKSHGHERTDGHVMGVNTVEEITRAADDIGIKYLTMYAFSTENWNRPAYEVDILMHLIVTTIEKETPDLIKNNVKLEVIGDIDRMPDFAYTRLMACCEATKNGTGLTLVIAFSYSSRWELTAATKKIAEKVKRGELQPEDITDDTIRQHLATANYPDPDLLIRTGGDFRVSNFLLWQIAYSEIYVTDTFWPDFTREEFYAAIDNFRGRERRFGLISEQLKDK